MPPSARLAVLKKRFGKVLSKEVPFKEEGKGDTFKVPFNINKSGFPLDPETWERLWGYAKSLYPNANEQIDNIRITEGLQEVGFIDFC